MVLQPHVESVQHVVLIELDDSASAPAMIQDMDNAFAQIPQIRRWDAGPHIDTGRPVVLHWYTIGLTTEFASVDDYRAYLAHPAHQALVAKWKPHWKRSEMFDFGSSAPSMAERTRM